MLSNLLAKSNSIIFPSNEKYSNSKVSDKIKKLVSALIILNNIERCHDDVTHFKE